MLTLLATVLALGARAASAADNAADDFSPISNPTGNWSYGTTPSVGAPFSLFTVPFILKGLDDWSTGVGGLPSVAHNPTDSIIHGNGSVTILPGTLVQHPGPLGECSVVRWTAPIAGTVQVAAQFTGVSGFGGAGPTTTDVHVLQNDVAFFDAVLNIGGSPNEAGVVSIRTVAAGDHIDFVVGFGNGTAAEDTTGMEATVTYQPAPVEVESWGSTKARYRD